MGPIRCPETSVKDYHSTPRYIPEERRSHQHRGGRMGPIRCPETSVKDYHSTLRYTPEGRRSHRHCSGSLKSPFIIFSQFAILTDIPYQILAETFKYAGAESLQRDVCFMRKPETLFCSV
jgi:hypothetical protein